MFEKINYFDELSDSFKNSKETALCAFEVSSEGELEQIRPLVELLLKKNHKIEIMFCSKSVEHKCVQIAKENPKLVRILRLPLLSFRPWSKFAPSKWSNGKVLFLCRYDFFPHLMLWGSRKDVSFILLSATLKNKEKALTYRLKRYYRLFDFIVCATEQDRKRFHHRLGIHFDKMWTYDFRIVQICERIKNAPQVFKKHSNVNEIVELFKKVSHRQRIIFGSMWPIEAQVFSNERFVKAISNREFLAVCAPHQLSKQALKNLEMKIIKQSNNVLPVYYLTPQDDSERISEVWQSFKDRPGVIILTHKGILCELYSLFHIAMVGGGHGRSIHSVLEPYLAGCLVFCGPKVHRSTEFDSIVEKEPQTVTVVEKLKQFYSKVELKIDENINYHFRQNMQKDGNKMLNSLLDHLLKHRL
ncbi:MAG: glycosyltransferase N-terminal domain-containing protein [Bacteriovoracia bacterium]